MRRAAPICQPAATFPQCPCIPRHFPRARETARRGLPPASTPRCADLPPHTREIAAAGEQRGGRRARALHPSVSRPGEGLDDGARGQRAAGEQRGGRRARALHPSVSRPGEGLDDGAREGGGGRAARRQAGKGIAPVCFGPRRGAGRRGARGRRAGTRRAGAPLPAPPLPFAARAPALPFSSVSRPAHAPLPAPPAFRPARRKNCARAVHARAVVLY